MANKLPPSEPISEELKALIKEAKEREVTEEELREQRISFAYGNAMNIEGITKENIRKSAESIRFRR